MHPPSFSRPGCSPSSPNPASGGDHGAAAGAAPAAQAQTLSQPEMFQQHTQGHQLLLSPSGGERRMLETMAESHVKILTECSLQLSLGDVLPASPYGKHGHVSGQGKSFGHAGFAPCMVSKHKPPALPLAIQGNKAGTFCTGAQSRRDPPELGGVLSAGSARQHTQRLRVTGYAET